MVVRRVTFLPFLGINVTATVQAPRRTPTMLLPRKTHRDAPETITIRILPFDVLGTFIATAEATDAPDTLAPRRIESF